MNATKNGEIFYVIFFQLFVEITDLLRSLKIKMFLDFQQQNRDKVNERRTKRRTRK